MKICYELAFLFIILSNLAINGQTSLPVVFVEKSNDIIGSAFELEAASAFNTMQVPGNKEEWVKFRKELKATLIEKTGTDFYPELDLDYQETGSARVPGMTVKNIYFQTRPGIYATANLYIPDGDGPFPGVVTMMGHSSNGRLSNVYQAIGHTLAQNGYVSLHIDPWGAGERTREHGKFEYHGANLGASLMNVGETLMGLQITDNMRAVDLLSSLPYVDPEKIGATGASGGGNQTMWLAAMDERVKAAVPVVSVGTFQSYVMNSNCICETLIDGLKFTEEAAILGMVAPRAIKICNGSQDANKAFSPAEMLRSFERAKPIYALYDTEENLANQIFDRPHGYWPEMREAMIGWFDFHLKGIGTGEPKKEQPMTLLPEEDLMTFESGERSSKVITTSEFCYNQGTSFRNKMLADKKINVQEKKEELHGLLKIPADNSIQKVHQLSKTGVWDRFIIETTNNQLIPVLLYSATKQNPDWIIMVNPEGKTNIPKELIDKALQTGKGVCIIDLWGTGENVSTTAAGLDAGLPAFHTLSRSGIWLGKTIQGIWISQLDVVSGWLKQAQNARHVTIDATKEAALAALFLSVLEENPDELVLRNAPLSYLFDASGDINYFSMAIHLPGILKWGDISLAAGISGNKITFENPVSISGKRFTGVELAKYQEEFKNINRFAGNQSEIEFREQ